MRDIHKLSKYQLTLKEALLMVQSHVAARRFTSYGICDILAECSLYDCESIRPHFSKWDKFSGDDDFPVPPTGSNDHPEEAYTYTHDLWTGEYGALRLELLRFLIDNVGEDE